MAKKATASKTAKTKPAKAKATPAKAMSTATVDSVLKQLKSLGSEKVRAQNAKNGAGDNQYGVMMGDIRKVANAIKTNHELALALWKTGNIDAQLVATLIIKPDLLSKDEMEQMVKSVSYMWLADWLHSYVLKLHADKESLRVKWMTAKDRMAARAGWRLTSGRIAKTPEGIDVEGLLDRIEKEMGSAAPEVQWTMNMCLAEIGINFPKLRSRAIAIGEKLGVYRDYPCSKGCTSPFAPIWIDAMVKRQK